MAALQAEHETRRVQLSVEKRAPYHFGLRFSACCVIMILDPVGTSNPCLQRCNCNSWRTSERKRTPERNHGAQALHGSTHGRASTPATSTTNSVTTLMTLHAWSGFQPVPTSTQNAATTLMTSHAWPGFQPKQHQP